MRRSIALLVLVGVVLAAPAGGCLNVASHTGVTMATNLSLARAVGVMPADQIFASNTTLADLAGLVFDVKAGQKWKFRFVVFFDHASANANFKFKLTGTATTTSVYTMAIKANASLATKVDCAPMSPGPSYPADIVVTSTGNNQGMLIIEGVVHVAAAGDGNVRLQAAQNTSHADESRVYKTSSFEAHQIE